MDELVFRILSILKAGEVLVAVPSQIQWGRLADASVPVHNSHSASQQLAFSLRRDLIRAGLVDVEVGSYSAGEG